MTTDRLAELYEDVEKGDITAKEEFNKAYLEYFPENEWIVETANDETYIAMLKHMQRKVTKDTMEEFIKNGGTILVEKMEEV